MGQDIRTRKILADFRANLLQAAEDNVMALEEARENDAKYRDTVGFMLDTAALGGEAKALASVFDALDKAIKGNDQ